MFLMHLLPSLKCLQLQYIAKIVLSGWRGEEGYSVASEHGGNGSQGNKSTSFDCNQLLQNQLNLKISFPSHGKKQTNKLNHMIKSNNRGKNYKMDENNMN